MDARQFLVALGACLSSLIIGVVCLFWPHSIQRYALRTSVKRPGIFWPYEEWMKTRQYLWSLRFIGALAIGAFILVLVGLIRRAK